MPLSPSTPIHAKKTGARAALVQLDTTSATVLRDTFRQFSIDSAVLGSNELAQLESEKFDACALRLDQHSAAVLKTIRHTPSNSRMVIFAVGDAKHLVGLSQYGINVVLDSPVDRRAALRAVKSTHLLIVHEFRRYVRLPIASDVKISLGQPATVLHGTSMEISAGGMSLNLQAKLPVGTTLDAEFELPGAPIIKATAVVRWCDEPKHLLGLRFEDDRSRQKMREWVDDYLSATR